jgi:hypothetical protein
MSAVVATDVSNTSASDKTILHIRIAIESSKPNSIF